MNEYGESRQLDSTDYLAEQGVLDRDQAAWRRTVPDLEIRQVFGTDGARIIGQYIQAEVERLMQRYDLRAISRDMEAIERAEKATTCKP